VSLLLLTLGVALVQLPTHPAAVVEKKEEGFFHKHFSFSRRAITDHASNAASGHGMTDEMNPTLGLVAVFSACMLSGLAGVYFEKVLKGSSATLWVRNVQLSFFSLFPALFVGVLWKDGSQIMDKVSYNPYIADRQGFFYGYNGVVWTAIGFQAIGGIVVALCVAYADNILKNFATSVSILISFVVSVYCFNFVVTRNVHSCN
jgi:solute carrier family 35 (UDP-sugar transporter), member A1/2/3